MSLKNYLDLFQNQVINYNHFFKIRFYRGYYIYIYFQIFYLIYTENQSKTIQLDYLS
jgi:hypothetical protein